MNGNPSISMLAPTSADGPSKSAVGSNPTSTSYRMVALDLDGTLLNTNHKMADVQAEYLRQLHQQGVTVCIATGRSAPSVYESVKKLQIPTPLPVVCSNGARGFLCDYKTMEKKELFNNPVPKAVVELAVQLVKEHGYALQYYYEDSIYCNPTTPQHREIMDLYMSLTGSHVEAVTDDFASLLEQGNLPSKLLVLFDESQLKTAVPIFQTALDEKATIVLGAFDWFLEILNPQVTKGHGLANMCKALKIPLEECIAMGDGLNDVEFLEMAGLGVAMKNAKDSVKKRANITSEWTNDEHGVMKMLETLQDRMILDPAKEE
jgi:Cof subfamily protein (haloacid dehalogenase superfamily)